MVLFGNVVACILMCLHWAHTTVVLYGTLSG